MNRTEIEAIYRQEALDRDWWGDFPEPQELLGKDFPETSNVYSLLPVCARIALQVTGELPRVVFSKDAHVSAGFDAVILNPEILSMRVSEKIRSEVFFGQYIHQLGHICYSRGVYERYNCSFQQKYFYSSY